MHSFAAAHLLANEPGNPDPEFDKQGHEEARWGNHSWRRFGDKVARDSREIHELSPTDLDLFCGWNLTEISKDMQILYEGMQRAARVKRAELTRQI